MKRILFGVKIKYNYYNLKEKKNFKLDLTHYLFIINTLILRNAFL
jgi:hypothetical protein